MMHGDIANHRSVVIGVRCENTLFKLKNATFKDKIINTLTHPILNAEIDEEVFRFMSHIYWNTEMTIMLIVDDSNLIPKVQGRLMTLPFNQICNIRSLSEVTMMLNVGDLSYFVDNDKIELQNVNSKYAVDIHTINSLIPRSRKVKHFDETY